MYVVELWEPRGATEREIAMLGRVLHACVHAGASVSFILPFTIDEACAFWRDKVLPGALSGERKVLVAKVGGEIVGTVQLILDTPPNQSHRADIAKLLVHPEHRRLGIARALMLAVEEQARGAGRSLLTLDTLTGSAAEDLYNSLGYSMLGVIPRYSRATHSTELEAATFYYKQLA